MDTIILNFKRKELVADSKDDAIKMAEDLFQINGDATQAFNNWKQQQVGGITDRDVKAFMLEYLNKKSKNTPGVGYIITTKPAVKDTRERPYKFTKVKGNGRREYKTVHRWIDCDTHEIICETTGDQNVANVAIKELLKSGKYKGKADLIKEKVCCKGNPVVAHVEYTPSKNTRKGTWIVFGVEA